MENPVIVVDGGSMRRRLVVHPSSNDADILGAQETALDRGEPWPEGDKVKHRPFHSYTMKQAIDEGFILDVLKSYTPVQSYYKLVKKVADDPQFDANRATKKLRRFVESHDLKPGESVEVESRDEAADSVLLRGKHNRRITIGTRAASKLLVESDAP